MKLILAIVLSVFVLEFANGLPVDRRKNLRYLEQSPEYGPAFDEVVVNSSLNIKRKNYTRPTRQIPNFPSFPFQTGGAAGSSQAQAFNSFGPVADFGAAATGSQTQSFNAGPGGLGASAGLSGTQQYNLNGMQIDINFSDAFSSALNPNAKGTADGTALSVTVTGLDGKKRPIA